MDFSRFLITSVTYRGKQIVCILLLILLSTSRTKGQTSQNATSSGLLCKSDCETCPVVCSGTPPPPNHQPPPEPHCPPPQSQALTPPLPPEKKPTHSPPAPYVYYPGTDQQNISQPYIYIYASEASSCNMGFGAFTLFLFFQVVYNTWKMS